MVILMVTRETALKNYISVLRFIMDEYNKMIPLVFSTPCIDYDSKTFFKEKDPFKIVLQWNTFFRRNMHFFYSFIVEDDINYFETLITKNNFDRSIFEDDLIFFIKSCKEFNYIYSEIKYIEDINSLDVQSVVEKSVEISNLLKHLKINRDWFMSKLDFKYPKLFFMPNVIHNLAGCLYHEAPNLMFNREVETSIMYYLLDMVPPY